MVLVNRSPFPDLDISRVVGLSAAIAVNVWLFLLLALPTGILPERMFADDAVAIPIEFIRPAMPVEVVRVPAMPEAPERPREIVQPITPVRISEPTDVSVPVAVPIGPPSDPVAYTTPTPVSGAAPPALSQLQYIHAPAPPYPGPAIRRGIEGTVLLLVHVDEFGRPTRVEIARSSGAALLDNSAAEHVLRKWHFAPAQRGGAAVPAKGLVPIDYRISKS